MYPRIYISIEFGFYLIFFILSNFIGGLTIAGTAGYCVGHLNIPDYDLPYESKANEYPPSFASPLKVNMKKL